MNVHVLRKQVAEFARTLGVKETLKKANHTTQSVFRTISRLDQSLIDTYLQRKGLNKLHLGSGAALLEGWLNSDYYPTSPQVLRLDATKPFPFASSQFDYVFSEHMIEHISYQGGRRMLSECHRVLKPGGKVRISTPDMRFLIGLYGTGKSAEQEGYIAWAVRTFVPDAPAYEDTFAINNFVRAWGHTFIYDEKTLRGSLENAGFTGITACELNASTDPELANLEHEDRMPCGFLRLESLTLEATKAS
jgi:predicted SAM-dependent methyltransferase